MKILIADDEEQIRKILTSFLTKSGHEVHSVSDGQYAVESVMLDGSFDVVILDVMMPRLDGISACNIIKDLYDDNMKVMILTAKSTDADELECLNARADDYMSKPFGLAVLLKRLENLVKSDSQQTANELVCQGIVVNLDNMSVSIDNTAILLTQKEYEILLLLIRNSGTITSRDIIMDKVWDYSAYCDNRVVDTHIKNLRLKLGQYGDVIKTKRGYGYIIEKQ